MKIWAHTLVKNEENYIWYAINSVIDWVDKVLVWDTGSTDKTVEIVKKIKKRYPDKIVFSEYGSIDAVNYWKPRDEMIRKTKADWILTLDGDEVWWEDSIKKAVEIVKSPPARLDSAKRAGKAGTTIESIVVKTVNLIGDIYHYQEEAAGRYKFKNKEGHYNLRLFSTKIPGLRARGEHGKMGYFDSREKPIQEREKVHILDASYMHFTHLSRSPLDLRVPKREKKLKYEIGVPFSSDYYYPEVFFRDRPKIVSSVWKNMTNTYLTRAILETPFKRIKRRLFT